MLKILRNILGIFVLAVGLYFYIGYTGLADSLFDYLVLGVTYIVLATILWFLLFNIYRWWFGEPLKETAFYLDYKRRRQEERLEKEKAKREEEE